MRHVLLATSASPGRLGSWRPLVLMLGGFAAAVAALAAAGRRRDGTPPTYLLPRISSALERLTGIPGWAAAAVGTASFGLLVAGMGFYNDVAWHVKLGRDKNLFTAPHSAIVVGLFLIFAAAVVGVLAATFDAVDTRLRVGRLRVPVSMLVMGLLGGSALGGFPLDDLWHHFYGIDVTMWSPTHLLMIVGASLSPLASWIALAEAGVRPRDGAWARGAYVLVACCVLLGLASVQGEFAFGVPQFQQLYHPVLIVVAAGIALTATRLVLGGGWTLVVGGVSMLLGTGGGGGASSRAAALFVPSAVAVELAALLMGTRHRLRWAVACGVGIATLGLAGEWWWNQHAFQPWRPVLVHDALPLCLVAAVGAAVVGTALGTSLGRERIEWRRGVLAAGALAVLAALAWPLPRHASSVVATVEPRAVGGNRVVVTARVDPPEAPRGARWFQALAWQGGGFVVSDMVERSPGVWVSSKPVPVGGAWKTILRLQRGTEMGAIPIALPSDPEIGKPAIPAKTRTQAFGSEQRYLLREQHGGAGWFAVAVFVLLCAVAAAWTAAFVWAARGLGKPERSPVAVAGPAEGERSGRASSRLSHRTF